MDNATKISLVESCIFSEIVMLSTTLLFFFPTHSPFPGMIKLKRRTPYGLAKHPSVRFLKKDYIERLVI